MAVSHHDATHINEEPAHHFPGRNCGSRRHKQGWVDGTHIRIPSLGADPEVFLLIRAALDRLNLRVKPADAVLEGGVLAARDRLVMEGVSRRVNVTREPDLPCSPVEAVVESDL